MNVLVLNGSPKGKNSNTMILTRNFLTGLNSCEHHNLEFVDLSQAKIEHCLGCFECWKVKSPLSSCQCVIKDDAASILELFSKSDLVIWSFPLYHFGIPSKMKAFVDRTLPLACPQFCSFDQGAFRPDYFINKKHVLISTCGYNYCYSFVAVKKFFETNYGEDNIEAIFLRGGNFLYKKTDALTNYFKLCQKVGQSYSLFGRFFDDDKKALSSAVFDDKTFYTEILQQFGALPPSDREV